MNELGRNKTSSSQSPINVSVYKPSGMSSIFQWFGKKNKNELSSSFIGKNCFKLKLNSLDLDSLNINSDDMNVLKSTLKMKQNGPRGNVFKITKNQLGMKEDEFFSKFIAPNLIKSKKGHNKGTPLWPSSSLSITSKQKIRKTCSFSTVGRIKSRRSLVENSSSSSKTTLTVRYKKNSKLNIPKPTYNSILMKSIPPNILKSNIENPVFVPIRCISKRNSELANKATNESNYIEQAVIKDLETKTKVIPVLMKKIKSMEDQISTISSATKQIKEDVSQHNVLSEFYSKTKEQTDKPLTLERSQSQKLPNTATRKKKRVKAKRFKTSGKTLSSRTSPFNSASESGKNLNFVFEPKTHAFSASTGKHETPKMFHYQTLPQETKLVKETNEPIQPLFDAYPNLGWDTIVKMCKDLSEEDSVRPAKEIGNSSHQIDLNKSIENNPLASLFNDVGFGKMIEGKDMRQFLHHLHNFPSVNDCEVVDLTSKTGYLPGSLIDLSVPLEKNTSTSENPLVCSMDNLNRNVSPKVIDGVLHAANENLVTRDESCRKCKCRTSELVGEELNEKTNERENKCVYNDGIKKSVKEIVFEPEEKLMDSQQTFREYKSCEDLRATGSGMPSSGQIDRSAGTKKSDNVHGIQPENIFDWIQNACSNKDTKPEVSITIQVKDEKKCLILESLTPTVLEADTNEKLINEKHGETNDDCLSGVSEPKVQSYNTRSILTTSEGVQYDKDPSKFRFTPLPKCKEYSKTNSIDDIPLKNVEFERKHRQFYSLENMTPVKSFEFESAGRGDVHSPTIKASWRHVEKERSREDREEKELVLNGSWDYLDRKRRAMFDEQIQSKTAISDADRPTPNITLAHVTVSSGIGDSMLESLDTKHYKLDSDTDYSEYPFIMQPGNNDGLVISMSSEILKCQDNVLTLASHLDSQCFQYDSALGSDPGGKTEAEQVIPKATQSSGFFRCIEADPGLENNKKIKVDSKRRPLRCGLTSLQDIQEVIEDSEEELIEDAVDFYEKELGDNFEIHMNKSTHGTKNVTESPIVVSDVGTRKSSVSVQTDWSLVGITVDHFHSSTCLDNRDKPSVGCQTNEMMDDDQKLVFSSSLLTDSIDSSKFCGIPSGTNLSYPGLHFAANSGRKNAEIKVSELFLNVLQHNSELENNVSDLDTTDTLGNFGKGETIREVSSMVSANESSIKTGFQDARSYGCKIIEPSAGYESETVHTCSHHTCSHPCFSSFSDEIINSDVDNSGSDAFIQPSIYGFPSRVYLMNSDIINIGNHESDSSTRPCVLNETVDVKSLTKTNSFCKGSSVSRFPIISNVISSPQTLNEYADVYKFGSSDVLSNTTNHFGNLANTIDSTPVASVGEICDPTKTEGPSLEHGAVIKKRVIHNSYVVNYLYKIEYDQLERIICYYE